MKTTKTKSVLQSGYSVFCENSKVESESSNFALPTIAAEVLQVFQKLGVISDNVVEVSISNMEYTLNRGGYGYSFDPALKDNGKRIKLKENPKLILSLPEFDDWLQTYSKLRVLEIELYTSQLLGLNKMGKKVLFNPSHYYTETMQSGVGAFKKIGYKPSKSALGKWVMYKSLFDQKFSDTYYARLATQKLLLPEGIAFLKAGDIAENKIEETANLPQMFLRKLLSPHVKDRKGLEPKHVEPLINKTL